MILTPMYCSSEPPPASGPVRSKITPILNFLSWAWAEAANAKAATAAKALPAKRARLTLIMRFSLIRFFVERITEGEPGYVKALATFTRGENVEHQRAGRVEHAEQERELRRVSLDLERARRERFRRRRLAQDQRIERGAARRHRGRGFPGA